MVRNCVIFILALRDDVIHSSAANEIEHALARLDTVTEHYIPHILECDENPESFQKAIMEHPAGSCNLLVSIGLTITQMLPQIYAQTGEIQTIFFDVIDPMGQGIVDSLEKTGHCYSGVVADNRSVQHHADQIKVLYPAVQVLFIPYVPTSFGGAVGQYALELRDALEIIGFSVLLKAVSTPQEGLDEVNRVIPYVDAVLLLETCILSDEIQEYVSYTCAAFGKMLISSNGFNGMALYGAACSYGGAEGFSLIPSLMDMVQRFWRDGKRMEDQPVVQLSNVRKFHVNTLALPWLPREVLEAIHNHPEIKCHRLWVNPPLVGDDGYTLSLTSIR